MSLKGKLDDLYNEKIILQKQQISIVDNINAYKTNVYGTASPKYRIRGNANASKLESYLKSSYLNCNIIQMEVQYKYKSVNNDTTNVSNINSSLFTDWNTITGIERERKLIFNNSRYAIVFENYSDNANIIKWNQIDIPITQGEDVIVRVRYKYTVGQPFMNLYTPWSDEFTVVFPEEFNENTDLTTIINQNDEDEVSAKFSKTLINDGYTEHVNNKIIDGSQKFFHMPENIYSGFNTPENNLMSLKDKLQSLSNDIEKYKELVESDIDSKYSVYLTWGENNMIELLPNIENKVTFSSSNTTSYTVENLNIIIKNTGTKQLKLYSIFPGNVDKYLINLDDNVANQLNSVNYENVPILIETNGTVYQTSYQTAHYQTLGQIIYFRKSTNYNIYSYYIDSYKETQMLLNTLDSIYNNSNKDPLSRETIESFMNKLTDEYSDLYSIDDYVYSDKQLGMPLRYRHNVLYKPSEFTCNNISFNYTSDNSHAIRSIKTTTSGTYDEQQEAFKEFVNTLYNDGIRNYDEYYNYDNIDINDYKLYKNNFIFRYEHFYGLNNNTGETVQLTPEIFNEQFILNSGKYTFKYSNKKDPDTDNNETIDPEIQKANLRGGFLVPVLKSKSQILCKEENNTYTLLGVGETINIPLLFQYYLFRLPNENENPTITKSLSFDIKKSLLNGSDNYVISLTAISNAVMTDTQNTKTYEQDEIVSNENSDY